MQLSGRGRPAVGAASDPTAGEDDPVALSGQLCLPSVGRLTRSKKKILAVVVYFIQLCAAFDAAPPKRWLDQVEERDMLSAGTAAENRIGHRYVPNVRGVARAET